MVFFSAIKVTTGRILSSDLQTIGSEEAQTLRMMPSDENKEGLSAVSQVRSRIGSRFSNLWRRFPDRMYS